MPDDPKPFYATPRQPRLLWNGRDKRRVAEPLPSQTIEVIRPFYADQSQGALNLHLDEAPQNRLIWTNDNLVALTSLLAGDSAHPPLESKVDLIYIDPPFAVQSDFKINVEIENGVADEKLPTLIEELAYKDTWKDGLDSYLCMMRDRLELLKRLLAPTGSIYVHCDWHAGHYIKVLMDEVFGYENFVNDIIWRRKGGSALSTMNRLSVATDTLLWYSRSGSYTFNLKSEMPSEDYIKQNFSRVDEDGRRFQATVMRSPSPRPNLMYDYKGYKMPPNGWSVPLQTMKRLDSEGYLYFPGDKDKQIYKKIYLDEYLGQLVNNLWTDIATLKGKNSEIVSFPTQKPVALLDRIMAIASNPGDIVLDCFCGSGTTAVAAETMKDSEGKPAPRRWIAIDCGKFAIHITRKRLIEAGARPFGVENVGFYTRHGEWKDIWQANPSARMYRDAMVEVYGGAPVDGFTYLHGKKGNRWVHIGPLNAPVADSQVESIVQEAAGTDIKAVDILSADIPIDWNKSEVEAKYGVKVQAKIIPQAAVEAVRERLRRKRSKDPELEAPPDIHFFSPPDVEVRAEVSSGGSAVVKLVGLTVDLDDCLSTQDPAKRAEIKNRISNWKALVDYWAVDWDYNGHFFRNDWQSFRTRKSKDLAMQAAHDYRGEKGDKRIGVKVTDIFGNDGVKVIRVEV